MMLCGRPNLTTRSRTNLRAVAPSSFLMGLASIHLVNLSTATSRLVNPHGVVCNGPTVSSPPDCKWPSYWYCSQFFSWNMGLSGIILASHACLNQLVGVRLHGHPVESLPEGFRDQRLRSGAMPAISEMDFAKDFNTFLVGNTLKVYT